MEFHATGMVQFYPKYGPTTTVLIKENKMPSENELLNALSHVIDPELGRNIVELTMVRDLKFNNGKVSLTIALTILGCPLREKIGADTRNALMAVNDVKDVEINFIAMTDEERQKVLGNRMPNLPKLNQFNQVKNVYAVMSGKGGVGKSSVTAQLAVALRRKGFSVGVLDADITGPSIPKMFGLPAGSARSAEQGFLPIVTGLGIKVMSINLLVQEDDAPVVWRGPMITKAIRQFWEETLWGKLDYLLVDMPPGTSDATITVVQSLPLCGVVMVTTPQELATMVVRKAVNMLNGLHIPIVGVIENMSFFPCPDSGKPHYVFGPSHAHEIADLAKSSVALTLPIDPQVAVRCDAGHAELLDVSHFQPMIDQLMAAVVPAE
jgi:ATP-binding protein involved in chromosome partitioning